MDRTLNVDCEVNEVMALFVCVVYVEIGVPLSSHREVNSFHISVGEASGSRVVYLAGVILESFQFILYEKSRFFGDFYPRIESQTIKSVHAASAELGYRIVCVELTYLEG